MNRRAKGAPQPNDEVARLVETIREAEAKLDAVTAGQVDAVVDAAGDVHLLQEGQRALQREVETATALASVRTALLNSLPSAIALIDADGIIVDVNEVWRRMTTENGGDASRTGIGTNYLEVCATAIGSGASDAAEVRRGIGAVMRGERKAFTLEYPCHSPDRMQWFRLIASPAGAALSGGIVVMHVDVTDRELAQRALRENVENEKATFEQAAVGIAHVSIDGRFLRTNDAFCALLGYDRDEIVGHHFAEFTHPDDVAPSQAAVNDTLVGLANRILILKRYQRKSGETVWTRLTSSLVHDADGKPNYFLSLIQDVTAERESHDHLERLNRLYRVLVESGVAAEATREPSALFHRVVEIAAQDGGFPAAAVILTDPEGRLSVAATAGAHAGYPRAIEASLADPRATRGPIRTALRTGEPNICADIASDPRMAPWHEHARAFNLRSAAVFPVLRGSAAAGVFVIWTHQTDFFKNDELGLLSSVARILSSSIEADDLARVQRETQDRLQRKDAQYRQLVESSRDVIWAVDVEGRITFINDACLAIYGYAPHELIGKSFFELVPPERLLKDQEAFARNIAEGKSTVEYESQVVRRDGGIVDLLATAHILRAEDGQVTGITGISKDVTERVEAQRRLAEQAALLDATNDAILVKDLDGRILFWNRGAERTFGWTAEEANGSVSVELLRAETFAYQAARRQLAERDEWNGELTKIRRDGKTIVVDCRWVLLRTPSGEAKSVLAIETDITERKEMQRNAFRTQRLENLGTLAGGIAHDLNNVFQPLFLAADLLLTNAALAPPHRALVTTIQGAAQRGADLVRQILSFARGLERDRIEIAPLTLLAELERVMHDTFPKSIRINVEVPRDVGTIIGDPTQYHQILLNLCVNARDAMPKGGTLTLSASREWLDEVYLSTIPNAVPGEWIRFEVRDTGVGIPKEIRDRIFEPFFTTKDVGKGTGLGLSTVIGIVRGHGGFVTVDSEPGAGTTFKVFLPVGASPTGSQPATAETTEALPLGTGELVLFVDDEEPIRRLGDQILRSYGYRVLLAQNGADAVAKFASHRDEVALVITDMAMPIMDGASTVIALRSIKPALRVIGSSGVTSEGGLARALAAGLDDVLPKPYTASTLLTMVHQVLVRDRTV